MSIGFLDPRPADLVRKPSFNKETIRLKQIIKKQEKEIDFLRSELARFSFDYPERE